MASRLHIPLPTMTWTKPVTSKLRKKSLRSQATNSQRYSLNSVSQLNHTDEQHGSRDRWSLVSSSGLHRASPLEDFVEVPEGVDEHLSKSRSSRDHRASDSPTWSFIDAEPSEEDVSPDVENDDCLAHSRSTTNLQSRPGLGYVDRMRASHSTVYQPTAGHQYEGDESAVTQEEEESPEQIVDYCGARSYWEKPVDLEELSQQIEELKVSYRRLSGSTRELYKKQENQFHGLQNARWEIEASRDEVEKHIDELKSERAQMQILEFMSRTGPAQRDAELECTKAVDADRETRAMLPNTNVRDFAIFNNIGQAAQRNRSVFLSRAPPQLNILHPKTNFREDFGYKTGTFIHRDVQAVHQNGFRTGWNHSHMPSYKRKQAPRKPTTKNQVLIEIGELPVSERIEALFSAEKFPDSVSRKTRKRETRWFTARRMADLLNSTMMWRGDRHDSVAEPI